MRFNREPVYEACKPEAHRTEKLIPMVLGLNDNGARFKINLTEQHHSQQEPPTLAKGSQVQPGN